MESLAYSPQRQEVSTYDLEARRLHDEKPELFEQVDLVLHLNAELARHDLAEDRTSYLKDERSKLVEQLLANPTEAILAEVDLLAHLYKDRSLVGTDYLGAHTTRFITRDPERSAVDLDFRVICFPSGNSRIQIEVPLRGKSYDTDSQPYFISVDSQSGLSIEQQVYRRGMVHRIPLPLDSDIGQERLWRFFTYSIMATELMDNRSENEKNIAHTQAKRLAILKSAES